MVEWHQRFNAHELGQTPGDGEGQGSLACCSPRGHKESDLTHRLNKNNSVPMNRQLAAQHPRAAAIPCSCLWSKGMGGALLPGHGEAAVGGNSGAFPAGLHAGGHLSSLGFPARAWREASGSWSCSEPRTLGEIPQTGRAVASRPVPSATDTPSPSGSAFPLPFGFLLLITLQIPLSSSQDTPKGLLLFSH